MKQGVPQASLRAQWYDHAELRNAGSAAGWGVSCALASQTQNAGSEIHSRILDGDGRVCQRSVGAPEFLYALRKKPCWNAPGNWNFFSNPPKETAITPFWMLCTIPVPNALCATVEPTATPETSACGAGRGGLCAAGVGEIQAGRRGDCRLAAGFAGLRTVGACSGAGLGNLSVSSSAAASVPK